MKVSIDLPLPTTIAGMFSLPAFKAPGSQGTTTIN